MTPKEFEKIRLQIQSERFSGDFDNAIKYGAARAAFERDKYSRLLAEAQKVTPPSRTIQRKVAQWTRQLQKALSVEQRMKRSLELANGQGKSTESEPASALAA